MSTSSDYTSSTSSNKYYGQTGEKREGEIARSIEDKTAELPSDVFLWAAGAAVVGSLALQIVGAVRGFRDMRLGGGTPLLRAPLASFIGMWVPSILLLGVYNKIVKVAGSDRYSR